MPWLHTCHGAALHSHLSLPTAGAVDVVAGAANSSVMTHGFNCLWAEALRLAEAGAIDYFLLHHADIEIRTPAWLDLMVAEMRRVGAAVLSAVVPIKDASGSVSTAVETRFPWVAQKLTLADCRLLPKTFSAADLPDVMHHEPPKRLLVNTGLMLVDLSRKEFFATDSNDELQFVFSIKDRIVRKKDGGLAVQFWPEDWEFSRRCNVWGLPVFATTAVQVVHHGSHGWPNYPPDEEGLSNG